MCVQDEVTLREEQPLREGEDHPLSASEKNQWRSDRSMYRAFRADSPRGKIITASAKDLKRMREKEKFSIGD